jgi:hypothetical protein
MRLWRAGAVLATLALAGWCVVAIAALTADPHNGANIGAGLLGLVAVALAVVAESFLIASAQQWAWKVVGTAAIGAWPVWLASATNELLDRRGLLILGMVPIGLLIASLVLLYRGWTTHAVQR